MRTKKVVVVDYDPRWADDFEAIRRELSTALGGLALAIEHVGSTAVNGLPAKPIIDIDIVIPSRDELDEVVAALARAGYIHEGDLGIRDREAFKYEGKEHLRKHHLYVCPADSEELKRHIAFRDRLRTHPEDAAAYAHAKREAARLYPEDIDGYIAHKGICIAEIYGRMGL